MLIVAVHCFPRDDLAWQDDGTSDRQLRTVPKVYGLVNAMLSITKKVPSYLVGFGSLLTNVTVCHNFC